MLILENGTGVGGADSLVSIEELVEARSKLYNATSAATLEMEAALRRAYIYMRSLEWAVPFPQFDGAIPDDVKLAQCVLAHYEIGNPEGLQPNIVPAQQKVLIKVGELGWENTGQKGAGAQKAVVTMAQDLLKGYLAENKTSRFLLRV